MRTKIIYLICLVLFAQMVFVSAVFAEDTKTEIKSKIDYYRGRIQENPNDAVAWNNLCHWFREDGQYDQAIAAGKKAIALDPFDFAPYHNLGHAYYDKGEYKKAIPHFKRAIELKGRKYTYNIIAHTYFELTDFKKAVYFYKKALDIDPNYLYVRDWLSWVYYCMGEYESALAQRNKVIEQSKIVGVGIRVDPGAPFHKIIEVFEGKPADKAGAMSGDEIIRVNDISMKNKTVAQLVESLKGEKGAKVRVQVRRQKKKLNLVIVRDIIGLPHSEESARMLSNRCLIYRKMGEGDKAMLDAELAIKMAPDSGVALGAVTLDAGNYEQAIKILSKANQEDVFVLLLMAKAYAMQEDFKEAMRLYEENIAGDEKLLKRAPYISEEQELFAALSLEIERILSRAKEFEDKDRFQEALDEYSKAMVFMDEERKGEIRDKLFEIIPRMPEPAKEPEIARKHFVRAKVFAQKGKPEDAIAEFKKAINSAPFISSNYFNISLVYAQIEDYRQAIHYMNIYAQVAPEATDAPTAREAKDKIIKWELELELE